MSRIPSLPVDAYPADLLETLLNVSLTGVILFRPLYGENGLGIIDLAYERLNPAAQRMLQLPERPAETFLTLYPNAAQTGIFAFYRDTYLSGKANRYDVNYSYDGLDNYFQLSAQPSGPLLVVSFSDTAEQDRSPVEQALRDSQVRERTALAELELARARLHHILMQAPALICIFEGPQHVFRLVNPPYQALVGERPLLDRPIREAMPELAGQPIYDLLDNVHRTGEPFYAHEQLVQLDHDNSGEDLGENYYNFVYQPIRRLNGEMDGILVFAYQVTTQVLARRQEQALNEELAATLEELRAANEEILAANEELTQSHQALEQLNAELEERVAQRTAQLREALRLTEQQKQQILEQQNLLERILGQVPASIATLAGPEHRYRFFNAHYQALSGNRTQLNRTVAEVFPEVVEQGFIGLLDEVYATGKPFIGRETPARLYDPVTGRHEQRYVDFIYQPLFGEEGQTQGILAFILDVTEKVEARHRIEALQAELMLKAQQQLLERETLHQVFEQTPAAICLRRGPEHRYTYVNPAYQALFPDRELMGRSLVETLPESAPQGFITLLDRVYQTGETYFGRELPLTLTRPDGKVLRTLYLNFTYQAYWEKGDIVGISTFAYEVTEQVLARREADRQRQLLQTLFMEAPAAICILNGPDLIYELVNPTYQQLFPGRTLLGKPIAEALPEIVSHEVFQTFRQVYQTGTTHQEQGILIPIARPEDGLLEDRYFHYIQQARFNQDGGIDGVLVFAFEVTDQVEARQQAQAMAKELAAANEELQAANEEIQSTNEELQVANQRLTRSNVDLDTFVYTASHDLKSPVISLDALLSRLATRLTDKLDHREQEMLALIQSSSQRLQQTIRDLTQIAQVQRDVQEERTLIGFQEVLSEILADLSSQLESSAAHLTVDFGVENLPYTRKNLRSILYNLVSNALKYCSPQRVPQILIRTYHQEGRIILTISDNGLGLTDQQRQGMFVMFKRFHTHVEGSGVGLYTIKRIIENYGGQITVDSQLGQGTAFQVQF